MLEVLISHLGESQFEAKARNHVIYCDQPVEGEIHVALAYPGWLEPRQRDGLAGAVHKCVIHNTLLHPPKIEVVIESGAATQNAA